MKEKMPNTAALIDELRLAFGKAAVDAVIKRGMRGDPGYFHARESGHEVGTPFPPQSGIPVSAMELDDPIQAKGKR
jgi:hypothetical protein